METATENRFWAYVSKEPGQGPHGECWEWQGPKTTGGYGQFGMNGKNNRSNRVAFEIANGPIPAGVVVRHECDNPPCCNPSHLKPGTHAQNVADRQERGRSSNQFAGTNSCAKGHPFDEVNTHIYLRKGRPIRICRACRNINAANCRKALK